MNFQTAGIGSLVGFVLSFLVALVSGIPLFDALVRAFVWAIVLGAGTLGAELLLRSQLPDLFGSASVAQDGPLYEHSGESVNIVLDSEESVQSFVEPLGEQSDQGIKEGGSQDKPQRFSEADSPAGEPMEELGSLLNPFNPAMESGDGKSEVPEFEPQETGLPESNESVVLFTPSRGADLEGLEQDPVILAKAVKSVMNKHEE